MPPAPSAPSRRPERARPAPRVVGGPESPQPFLPRAVAQGAPAQPPAKMGGGGVPAKAVLEDALGIVPIAGRAELARCVVVRERARHAPLGDPPEHELLE